MLNFVNKNLTTSKHNFIGFVKNVNFGSGALSGKTWLVRIVEINKIDAYFRAG